MLAAVVAAGVVASLGRHAPGMSGLVEALGPLALVRFPVKALLLAALPAAVLAGSGVHWVMTATDGQRPVVRKVAGWAGGLAAASLLLCVMVGFWGGFRQWLFTMLFARADETVAAGVCRSLLHGAIAVASVALVIAAARWVRPEWIGLLLAAVVSVDLALAGLAAVPMAPRTLLADEPPLTDRLRSHLGGGRLFRDLDPEVVHPRLAADTAAAAADWWISVLDGAQAANHGIPMVFHDDDAVVADRRIVLLTQGVRQAPWGRRIGPLSAAGVSLVMTPEEPPIEGLDHLVEVVTGSDPGYHLYRNPAVGGGVWWVARAVVVRSAAQALAEVTGEEFDPRGEVVLEGTPVGPSTPRWLPAWAMLEQRIDEFEVTVPAAGHLVFSEAWNPGWRVEVDGRELTLLRANYGFAAVAIDGGRHRVRRAYRPPEVTLGLWLTLAALCLVVVMIGVGARA
jgi:hypothetical protein